MASFINSVVNAVRGNRDRVAALERAVAKLTQASAGPIATGFDGGIAVMAALANQQDIVRAEFVQPDPDSGLNARIIGGPSDGRACHIEEGVPGSGPPFIGAQVIAYFAGTNIGAGGYACYTPIAGEIFGWQAWITGPVEGMDRDRYPWHELGADGYWGGRPPLTSDTPPHMNPAYCLHAAAWDPLIANRREYSNGTPVFIRYAGGATRCWFSGASDPVCDPECPDP